MNIHKNQITIAISTLLLFSCGFSDKIISFNEAGKQNKTAAGSSLGENVSITSLGQSANKQLAPIDQTSTANIAAITQVGLTKQAHLIHDSERLLNTINRAKLASIDQVAIANNSHAKIILKTLAYFRDQSAYRTTSRRTGKFMLNYLRYSLNNKRFGGEYLPENGNGWPANTTYKTQNADLFLGQIAADNPANVMPQGGWGKQTSLAEIANPANLSSGNVQEVAQTLVSLNPVTVSP